MSADEGQQPAAEISALNVENIQQAERDIQAVALRLEGVARALQAAATWTRHEADRLDKVITVSDAIAVLESQGASVTKLPKSGETQRLYRVQYQGRDERVTANDVRTLALSVEADPQFLLDAARMLRQVGGVFTESMMLLAAGRRVRPASNAGEAPADEAPKVYPY